MVNVTGHSAFDGTLTVNMYTSPYLWSSATEIDLTQDVKADRSTLTLNVSKHHTLKLRLINHNYKFFDTTSDYYMFRGKRIKLTFNGVSYKFVISRTPFNVSDDYIDIECTHHSIDLDGSVAQIRVNPDSTGNLYLEDIMFQALYDTGLYNHFRIKDSEGEVYRPGGEGIERHSISVENEIVYWNSTPKEILDDLCSRAGCIWYCTDISGSDHASYINIIDITTDYDVAVDNIVYLSGDKNLISANPTIDRKSIVNKIIVDNIGLRTFDEDSIDSYGPSKPMVVSMPTDANIVDFTNYINKYISYSKDPEISCNFKCNYFVDITDLNKMVKVVDSDYNYDTAIGLDRKYRITSVIFNLTGNTTTITAGSLARTMVLEKLGELMGKDSGTTDENKTRNLIKGGSVKLQVHTDRSLISTLDTASDNGLHGIRLGIDSLYQATVSDGSVFYMDDDGVRTGN